MGTHTQGRRALAPRPWRRGQVLAALALLPVGVSAFVVKATHAAFTASTTSAGNAWSAGHVSLTSDAAGAAVFSPTNLVPADTGTACVTVTYTGSVDAAVRLYATSVGALGTYLDLVVTEGTGATNAACAGFVSSSTLYTGTLAAFAAAKTNWTSGVSAWAPAGGSNDSASYRFQWTLQDNNAAQSQSATTTFTWEAHNT